VNDASMDKMVARCEVHFFGVHVDCYCYQGVSVIKKAKALGSSAADAARTDAERFLLDSLQVRRDISSAFEKGAA
jgi:hypothetical protein